MTFLIFLSTSTDCINLFVYSQFNLKYTIPAASMTMLQKVLWNLAVLPFLISTFHNVFFHANKWICIDYLIPSLFKILGGDYLQVLSFSEMSFINLLSDLFGNVLWRTCQCYLFNSCIINLISCFFIILVI